jgi:DNA polymerase III alpha subunit
MQLDSFSNPIFNDADIFNALYKGYEFDIDNLPFVEPSDDIEKLEQLTGIKFSYQNLNATDVTAFDKQMQSKWVMPNKYKQLDIEEYLVNQCPKQHYPRLIEELQEYRDRDMLDLLRWLKYFVDTMQSNNLVWGVGRGSSVASYALFLIGVHKIDSIKYNLDWQEFLR